MAFLTALDVAGDTVNLAKTHMAHLGGVDDTLESGKNGDFSALLMKALNGVNQLQLEGAQGRLAEAKARLELAESKLRRARELFDRRFTKAHGLAAFRRVIHSGIGEEASSA